MVDLSVLGLISTFICNLFQIHEARNYLSVFVWKSVPEVENVVRPILMKLAPEVGLIEIDIRKAKLFCFILVQKLQGGPI